MAWRSRENSELMRSVTNTHSVVTLLSVAFSRCDPASRFREQRYYRPRNSITTECHGAEAAPSSDSYAPAEFRIEFGSNRSDDVCGIILGETADEKHLIGQRQAGREVLWEHSAGSRPCKRQDFLIIGSAHNGGYSWILLACIVKNTFNRMASIERYNDDARADLFLQGQRQHIVAVALRH